MTNRLIIESVQIVKENIINLLIEMFVKFFLLSNNPSEKVRGNIILLT